MRSQPGDLCFLCSCFPSSPKVSSEDVGQLCQSVLQDFSAALSTEPAPTESNTSASNNGIAQGNGDPSDAMPTTGIDGIITSSLMVKLVTMAIMAATMLKDKGIF